MPKREDIKKILIIGSGPIVIGQACEFDYSGTQAVKALRAEGLEVVLVNPSPATIMTDPNLADQVYIEPISEAYLEKIISIEKPDAVLPTVGGQTALNAALNLYNKGILEKYNVELIGAKAEAIDKAEDRELFKKAMEKIGANCAKSGVAHTLDEAAALRDQIGFPIILRPSFTLGGTGGGVCYNNEEFESMVLAAISASPMNQVLVEQSILGWKEYEVEVMRDLADNVVIVCSIENLDPMGVHTGDSITVAPQQTLSDKEYQKLRDLSIDIIREIGVETGGSNIQFAVNPEDGEIIVIEMNPRVSRSSALASKATGFPIAKIAAKLSIGYTLDEIPNDITQKTPASFEPSIDYVVTKIPRFTFEKFPESPRLLDTQMRSVGEAMAIGRNFSESFQKALRSLEIGRDGWGADENIDIIVEVEKNKKAQTKRQFLQDNLTKPNDQRVFYVREAMLRGMSLEEVFNYSKIDPWFLYQFEDLLDFEKELFEYFESNREIKTDDVKLLELLKEGLRLGYSLKQFAYLYNKAEILQIAKALVDMERGSSEYLETESRVTKSIAETKPKIEAMLNAHKVTKSFKRVDTCAAEFESFTPYLYSAYDQECEADISDRDKVMILGGGPNRIGQGIEFDYCCCHASFALQDLGVESIMVNSNPETVSTDYDTSDRLYFEPLVIDEIKRIYAKEAEKGNIKGVIVQFGGQTPLKLAKAMQNNNIQILGTSPADIDRAEDRDLFNKLIDKLGLKNPPGAMAASKEEAIKVAEDLSYPVLVRPSYVLGGRAMAIVHNKEQLKTYMQNTSEVTADKPILIDSFLQNATEIDVDALCDGKDVCVAGILEHIEEAGVHSGDSACILPPKSVAPEMIEKIKKATTDLALELNVIGLINTQFAIYQNDLYVIEVNPRASRTVPFVSKAINVPLAKMATRLILGETLKDLDLITAPEPKRYHVKEVVLPFKKFGNADTILGPEMKSTGEVMGIGETPAEAFYKAQDASGHTLPKKGKIFVSVNDESKMPMIDLIRDLQSTDFDIIATRGTAATFNENGIETESVLKVHEGRPNIVDKVVSGEIAMIINIPTDVETRNDALEIRQSALRYNIPYFTTLAAALEAFQGMKEMNESPVTVYPVGD